MLDKILQSCYVSSIHVTIAFHLFDTFFAS